MSQQGEQLPDITTLLEKLSELSGLGSCKGYLKAVLDGDKKVQQTLAANQWMGTSHRSLIDRSAPIGRHVSRSTTTMMVDFHTKSINSANYPA